MTGVVIGGAKLSLVTTSEIPVDSVTFVGSSLSYLTGVSVGPAILPVSFLPINATTAPNISVGSRSALQWERTQAWTCIAFITVAAAPAASGAAIIFTTCNQVVSSTEVDPGFRGYEFWINDQGKLQVRIISDYVGSNYIGVIGSTVVTNGVRCQVAASYDGSSTAAGVKLYVNGVLETNTVESDTLSSTIVNSQPFYIGNQRGWPYSLGGSLDQFSLSKVVRNQAAIRTYTSAGSALDANTVLAYNFSEQSGKVTSDLSSNGFVGAMNGARWVRSGAVGNAPYWLQGKLGADAGLVPAPSTAVTLSAAVASGNSVIVSCTVAAGAGTINFSDDKSNVYTPIVANVTNALAGTITAMAIATNVTNGPSTFTATISAGNGTYWRVLAEELVNIKAASPVDASASLYNPAATGVDGATSGPFVPTANFDFIYGISGDFTVSTVTNGTGFSSLTMGKSTDNEPLYSEYFFQKTAGATAATFSPSIVSLQPVIGVALKSQ
jgi:hypothetical protein